MSAEVSHFSRRRMFVKSFVISRILETAPINKLRCKAQKNNSQWLMTGVSSSSMSALFSYLSHKATRLSFAAVSVYLCIAFVYLTDAFIQLVTNK